MGTVPSSTPTPSLANTPLPSMPKKMRTTSLEEALLNVATAGKHKLDTRVKIYQHFFYNFTMGLDLPQFVKIMH